MSKKIMLDMLDKQESLVCIHLANFRYKMKEINETAVLRIKALEQDLKEIRQLKTEIKRKIV